MVSKALFLSKAKRSVKYAIDTIFFNAETKELVATDGKAMLIVKIKSTEGLLPFNLEAGFYDVFGEVLLKSDRDVDSKFPNDYESIIPTSEKICSGSILSGIIHCMIKQQVCLDIWKYEGVLKILNKNFSDWFFINVSNKLPVMMEAENVKHNIKYIIMPTSLQ